MNDCRKNCLVYAVTDRSWLRGKSLAEQVEAAIVGGATMVQLREKTLKGAALETAAREVQEVCARYGVPFIVNDDAFMLSVIVRIPVCASLSKCRGVVLPSMNARHLNGVERLRFSFAEDKHILK